MLYAPRIQDGSEAFESSSSTIGEKKNEKLEERVEKLNAAIADVRKQLEELGENEWFKTHSTNIKFPYQISHA